MPIIYNKAINMAKIKLTKVLKEILKESREEVKKDQLFQTRLKKFDQKFEELKVKLREGGFNV